MLRTVRQEETVLKTVFYRDFFATSIEFWNGRAVFRKYSCRRAGGAVANLPGLPPCPFDASSSFIVLVVLPDWLWSLCLVQDQVQDGVDP